MAIAYLISEYPARSHTFIRREIAALRAKGVAIDIYAIRRPSKADLLSQRELDDYNETWHIMPPNWGSLFRAHLSGIFLRPRRYFDALSFALAHRLPGMRNAIWALFYFIEAVYTAQEMRRRGNTHLHVHFAIASAHQGVLIHRYTGLSWSMTLHGCCDFEYPAGPLLPGKLRTVEFANCASYFGRAQALRTLPPEEWHRIFVSRCGIEADHLPVPAPAGDCSERPLRIYCVGRLSSEKGHVGLLEAFAKCLEKGLNATLHLIGDGCDRTKIQNRIVTLGIADKVEMLGAMSEADVLNSVRNADIFALPSFMEGVPLVLMEAMALEVPVVAPRLAGIPELVEHEKNGLLFDPSNWDDMAMAILRIARNPELRARIISAAKAKVYAEFNVATAVEPLARRFHRAEAAFNAETVVGRIVEQENT